MTIAAERPAVAGRCRAERHGSSIWSYQRNGCRCPAAEAAYRAYRASDKRRRPHWRILKTNPHCPAQNHGPFRKSYLAGCRCPETVRVYWTVRKRETRAEIDRLLWAWRRHNRTVSRAGLALAIEGYTNGSTYAERMVATIRLDEIGWQAERIARRLKVDHRRISDYRNMRAELREQRTERRLAEAKAKAVRNAFVAERREFRDGQ
jgi:hypothetical protein